MNGWLEKELEDYAIANAPELFRYITGEPYVNVLGRQVRCPFGIIDLLAYQGLNLFIVEFKAVCADDKTAGQLFRYRQALSGLSLPDDYTLEMMDACPLLMDIPISLVAVAPSFTNSAMRGIDVCITAKKNQNGFAFERAKWPEYDKKSIDPLRELLRPYFDGIVRREMESTRKNNDDILIRSAQQRLLEVN